MHLNNSIIKNIYDIIYVSSLIINYKYANIPITTDQSFLNQYGR